MIPNIPNFPLVISQFAQPFYLTTVDATALNHLRYQLRDANPHAAIRQIHGTRCHSEPSLFSEFAAALQFPLYFGRNWDAFADCLSDLPEWTQAEHTGLIIADADHILLHDDDLPVKFFEVLRDVIAVRQTAIRVLLHIGQDAPGYDYRRARLLTKMARAQVSPMEIG
jgi:hypothetical protein